MSSTPPHPPIGSRFHREFRDLDTKRLPSAPPRPGSPAPKEDDEAMSKTEQVINFLLSNSTPDNRYSSRQIADRLGNKPGFDPGTIAALLVSAYNGKSAAPLRKERTDDGVVWWWEPANNAAPDDPPPASTDELAEAQADPQQKDQVLASIQAMAAPREIPDARLHADRLRALAEVPILDESVADWLTTLADAIEPAEVQPS